MVNGATGTLGPIAVSRAMEELNDEPEAAHPLNQCLVENLV